MIGQVEVDAQRTIEIMAQQIADMSVRLAMQQSLIEKLSKEKEGHNAETVGSNGQSVEAGNLL